jgi:hypothetical protein
MGEGSPSTSDLNSAAAAVEFGSVNINAGCAEGDDCDEDFVFFCITLLVG